MKFTLSALKQRQKYASLLSIFTVATTVLVVTMLVRREEPRQVGSPSLSDVSARKRVIAVEPETTKESSNPRSDYAGDQPVAFARPRESGDALTMSVLGASVSDSRRLRVVSGGGRQREVFVVRTADNQTCLVVRSSDGLTGVECNPSGRAFAGRNLVWQRSVRGGPALSTITEIVLSGLATDRVERLEYADLGDRRHDLALGRDKEFAYTYVRGQDPERLPIELIAYAANGDVIERVALPPAAD
jgi:hypothetical protein